MMNLETHYTYAKAVRKALDEIGVKPPKVVVDAFAVYDAVVGYELDEPNTDVAGVDAGKISELLTAAVDAEIRRGAVQVVRSNARNSAIGRLIGAVNHHTDEILTSVEAKFVPLAAKFSELFRQLPRDFDDSALVRAGADTVAVYAEAKVVAGQLEPFIALRRNLPAAEIIGALGVGTRFARCRDQAAAEQACAARGGSLGLLGELASVDGVELHWWCSVGDQRAHIATLPEAPKVPVATMSSFR